MLRSDGRNEGENEMFHSYGIKKIIFDCFIEIKSIIFIFAKLMKFIIWKEYENDSF